MYCKFYGFQQKPFHVTPDLDFFYLSQGHKQALGTVLYGVKEKKGLMTVTGEMGMGKTTLVRAFLDRSDPEKNRIICIFNPNLSFRDLLKTILRELGHCPLEGEEIELVSQLHAILIEESKKEKTVVLLIDEAQAMPLATLGSLRLLTNLETSKDKLIQIVLVGQPEFQLAFSKRGLLPLQQRIAGRARIFPLSTKESMAYIQYRLSRAGCQRNAIFTSGALSLIIRKAQGIPRKINVICDNSLVAGFGYKKIPVPRSIVKEVVADLYDAPSRPFWWWAPVMTGLFLVLLSLLLPLHGIKDEWMNHFFPSKSGFTVLTTQIEQVEVEIDGEQTLSHQKESVLLSATKSPFSESSPGISDNTLEVEGKRISDLNFNFETKVVREGDTLVKLVREAYGIAGPMEVKFVLEANPHLISANKIYPDQEVMIPFR